MRRFFLDVISWWDDIQEEATVHTIKEENIKMYIKSFVSTSKNEVDRYHIQETLKGLKFQVKIETPSAPIMIYWADRCAW